MHAGLSSIVAVMVFATLTACGKMPTYRYKLTVQVETPEGLRSGSSVVEVLTRKNVRFLGPEVGGIRAKVRGEAVAIDLGKRGVLFALLRSENDVDNASGIAPSALLPELVDKRGTGEAWADNLRAMKNIKEPALVPSAARPMLVRFEDISNPTSVELVEPRRLNDTFGPSVRLRRISVKITSDAVTTGIDKYLPWLEEYAAKRQRLNGKTGAIFTNGLPDNLGTGAFKRGLN